MVRVNQLKASIYLEVILGEDRAAEFASSDQGGDQDLVLAQLSHRRKLVTTRSDIAEVSDAVRNISESSAVGAESEHLVVRNVLGESVGQEICCSVAGTNQKSVLNTINQSEVSIYVNSQSKVSI